VGGVLRLADFDLPVAASTKVADALNLVASRLGSAIEFELFAKSFVSSVARNCESSV
jgi:hypothetical protein